MSYCIIVTDMDWVNVSMTQYSIFLSRFTFCIFFDSMTKHFWYTGRERAVWFIKKVFWMFVLPFVALMGVLMFAFPEEMKEFKKDLVDMVENSWLRWGGFVAFVFGMVHLVKFFDGQHTLVRWSDPNT